MLFRSIKQLGMKVPEDVSIVGFDGDPIGQFAEIQLTTMRQQSEEIGRVASELLLSKIKNEAAIDDAFWQTKKVIPTEFIAGNSIAVPADYR